MSEIVTIIGASEKEYSYANKAMKSLLAHGHEVRLVNPFKDSVEGYKCHKSITDIKEPIDTVTLYVNPQRFKEHIDAVIKSNPQRVIMNPGTEDSENEKILNDAGIEVERACTLVLLSTGQF